MQNFQGQKVITIRQGHPEHAGMKIACGVLQKT